MKKMFKMFAILMIMSIAFVGCQKDNFEILPQTDEISLKSLPADVVLLNSTEFLLTAGQHDVVGTVTVGNDLYNLYVTYEVTEGCMNEFHLYVTAEPLGKREAPGQAPFQFTPEECVNTFTFVIPFDEVINCNAKIYLQAHTVIDEETAYGGTIIKPATGSWFGNIQYTIVCDDDPDNRPPDNNLCYKMIVGEETAFGGDNVGSGKAWWYYFNGTGVQTIYAGQHYEIGTVELVNGEIVITFNEPTEPEVDEDGNTLIYWWQLADVLESVKIQGYTTIPTRRPAAGRFTYKGTETTVEVDSFPFYVIHLDVEQWVEVCETEEEEEE